MVKIKIKETTTRIKAVKKIPAKGFPVNQPGYREAHMAAERVEKSIVGEKRFKELKKIIRKKIPKSQLAGSHTQKGNILVSKKIPKEYHPQIITHEKAESLIMRTQRLRRRSRARKGKRRK